MEIYVKFLKRVVTYLTPLIYFKCLSSGYIMEKYCMDTPMSVYTLKDKEIKEK